MGKATILSHTGEGLYSVTLRRDTSRSVAEAARLTALLSDLSDRLVDAMSKYNAAAALESAKLVQLDIAILAYNTAAPQDKESTYTAMQAASDAAAAASTEKVRAAGALAAIELEIARAEKRLAVLAGIVGDETKSAWCADYQLALTGDVGTVEATTISLGTPIIVPGGEDGTESAYNQERDGMIQPVLSASSAAAFYNYAMAPGVDKWRRRYRVGTIMTITGDACTVKLDNVLETPKNLPVNLAVDETVAATIRYMSCNGAVFAAGSRVVVAFEGENHDQPVVIGFASNPKSCMKDIVVIYKYMQDKAVPIHSDHGVIFKKITLEQIGDDYIKVDDTTYVDNRFGQYWNGGFYHGEGHFDWVSSDVFAVYRNDARLFRITKLSYPYTGRELYAGGGTACAYNDKIFALYHNRAYDVADYMSRGTLKVDTVFERRRLSGILEKKVTLQSWTTTAPYPDPDDGSTYQFYCLGVYSLYLVASANESGIIAVSRDFNDPDFRPVISPPDGFEKYVARIFNNEGVVVAVVDADMFGGDRRLEYVGHSIASNSSTFFLHYHVARKISAFTTAGVKRWDYVFAAVADPPPPANWTGSTIIRKAHIAADDVMLTVVHSFEYQYSGFTPQRQNSITIFVFVVYQISAGAPVYKFTVTRQLEATEDVHQAMAYH